MNRPLSALLGLTSAAVIATTVAAPANAATSQAERPFLFTYTFDGHLKVAAWSFHGRRPGVRERQAQQRRHRVPQVDDGPHAPRHAGRGRLRGHHARLSLLGQQQRLRRGVRRRHQEVVGPPAGDRLPPHRLSPRPIRSMTGAPGKGRLKSSLDSRLTRRVPGVFHAATDACHDHSSEPRARRILSCQRSPSMTKPRGLMAA